jgi:hypothetical protein
MFSTWCEHVRSTTGVRCVYTRGSLVMYKQMSIVDPEIRCLTREKNPRTMKRKSLRMCKRSSNDLLNHTMRLPPPHSLVPGITTWARPFQRLESPRRSYRRKGRSRLQVPTLAPVPLRQGEAAWEAAARSALLKSGVQGGLWKRWTGLPSQEPGLK